MDRRSGIVIGLVLLVTLSGCASLISTGEGQDPTPTTTSPPTEPTATGTSTATSTTTTAATTTTTPSPTPTTTTTLTEEWSKPKSPNEPLQVKYANESENRIKSIAVGGEGSSTDGYATVELTVTANTTMPSVDPKEHGDIEGEPFILVYIDGHLVTSDDSSFATPRGLLVSRSDTLAYEDAGEFEMVVPQEAFETAGVEAGDETELMVMVMDKDSDWDDVYGKEIVTVTYQPS